MLKAYILMQTRLTGLLNRDDRGATAVEYGLMVALIAVVIIGAVAAIGTNLGQVFQTVADRLAGI
jgi:pilus assembly protein Flp/PilA